MMPNDVRWTCPPREVLRTSRVIALPRVDMACVLSMLLIPAVRVPASCHMAHGPHMARSLRPRCAAVRLDSELSLERVNPYVDTLLNSEWPCSN